MTDRIDILTGPGLPRMRLPVALTAYLVFAAVLFAVLPGSTEAAAPVLFHTPGYGAPVRGDPGDLLMIAGSGFHATDRVVYEVASAHNDSSVHPAGIPAQSDAIRGVAPIAQPGNPTYAITVRLPSTLLAHAVYRLWVVNAVGQWSHPVTINDPRPLWITPGYVYSTIDYGGLSRRVRVVGRNLEPSPGQSLWIKLHGPRTYVMTSLPPETSAVRDADTMQHYVGDALLPRRVIAGPYTVSVSRDQRNWTEIQGQSLDVLPDPREPPLFSLADARFGACKPDDAADDTSCLARAIEAARMAGGATVFVPAGTWNVSPAQIPDGRRRDGLVLPPGVHLRGAGSDASFIVRHGAQSAPLPGALLTLTARNSVTGVSFAEDEPYASPEQTRTVIQLGTAADAMSPSEYAGKPVDDVVITGDAFRRVGRAIVDSGLPIKHLLITHNEFAAYDNALLLTGNRFNVAHPYRIDDSVIRWNRFLPGSYIDVAARQGTIASQLGASQRLDFSSNIADGVSKDGLQDAADPGGWRAAFFWNSNNNHELVLVSENQVSCPGDKAGDGEAIAFDGNGNTFGFDAAQTVEAAGPDWITVRGPLLKRQNGQAVPDDYYDGHWIFVMAGAGLGQTRRVTSYSENAGAASLTFRIAPNWDVVPRSAGGRVVLGRQYWQVYVVANEVGQASPPCNKSNLSGPHGGIIGFWAPVADSAIEGNRQTDTDGIGFGQGYSARTASCPKCDGSASFVSALEIRRNTITGEYDWSSDCSRSGIGGTFGASPTPESPPPILSFGVAIAHNIITHADGLRGGAISIAQGWFAGPAPNDWPLVENLLIFHNDIQEITGSPPRSLCRYNQRARVGIRLEGKQNVRDAVVDANRCEGVDTFLEDSGIRTAHECSSGRNDLCECQSRK